MKYWDIIRTANANLRRSKLRTFLTMSAVFIGTLTLMLTTGVGAGLKSYVNDQINSVGAKDVLMITPSTENANPLQTKVQEYDPNRIQSTSSGFAQAVLQQKDLDKIAAQKGIKDVTPYYPTSPDYVTAGGKKYLTVLSETVDGYIQPMRAGRMIEQHAQNYEITIPGEYVQPLGFKDDNDALGKKVTFGFTSVTGTKFEVSATIVGIQTKAIVNGNQMVGNLGLIETIYKQYVSGLAPDKQAQYPNAFAHFDTSLTKLQLQDLKNQLKDQKYDAATLDDQLGIINSIITGITIFLNVFAGITLAAATFGIVNTLLMAVQERTKEIGLMKALGMRRRKIFALFSFEAILIGFWGALLALGAANLLGRLGNHIATKTILKDFEGLQLFSFPLKSMIPIILIIMLIAFLAATLPARRASKLDPIDALRYE